MSYRKALLAVLLASACNNQDASPDLASPRADLGDPYFEPLDLAMKPPCDGGDPVCGCDPYCHRECIGAPGSPLPLDSDPQPDPNERDSGLQRDPFGNLIINSGPGSFQFVWAVNSTDWGRGTVSKLNSRTLRETARYLTVTCSSQKGGSKQACDGVSGCCSIDDAARFAARQAHVALPGHQPVQQMDNRPSRSSVDFDGSFFVANRGNGGQPSVTHIANDVADCIDRNHDGKIETSADANGDGLIETDCNGDGVPDDVDGVMARPCQGNLKQEFFGLDDECVLWTANVATVGEDPRGLTLGPGAIDSGASDAWVATTPAAGASRIDGKTGVIKEVRALPAGCRPLGTQTDASGISWLVSDGAEPLCWFDTNSAASGVVRAPGFALTGPYGLSLDRDQNVWLGGGAVTPEAYRYTPDRSQKLANLGRGYWTEVQAPGMAAGASGKGRGIRADSRSANAYWVWLAVDGGYVVQIPGSQIKAAKMDQQIDGSQYPVVALPGTSPFAIEVTSDENVAVASRAPSQMIRILVDAKGVFQNPDLHSAPAAMMRCPAGDRCALKDAPDSEPGIDNYADFAGFGLRNFSRPTPTYLYLFQGACAPGTLFSYWDQVTWDAEVPPGTGISAHARTGPYATLGDTGWADATWSPNSEATPLSLNNGPDPGPPMSTSYLEAELIFSTQNRTSTPTFKSLCAAYWCDDTK